MKIQPRDCDAFCSNPPDSVHAVLLYGENQGLIQERAAGLIETVIGARDDPFRLSQFTSGQAKSNGILLQDEINGGPARGPAERGPK